MSKAKAEYTRKTTRNMFMRWLIQNYGYNKEDITDNPRILSDKYMKDTKINIPKISIYRWIRSFDKFVSDELQQEALYYIKEGVI